MVDNSDLQQKINIRLKGIGLLKSTQFSVLDLYAGTGKITATLWAKSAANVLCVEKQKGKCTLALPNVKIAENDNKAYIPAAPFYQVIDCDAYGLVMPTLKEIALQPLQSERLVFFTEFNPIAYKRDWVSEFVSSLLSLPITALYYEKAKNSSVLYGYYYQSFHSDQGQSLLADSCHF